MRKFYVVGLALFSVCALCALSAASASAVVTFLLAEWLVNGAAIPVGTEVASESKGKLTLIDLEGTLKLKGSVECGGTLVGGLLNDGEDVITTVLDEAGVEVSKVGLTGNALVCTNLENCITPLVWAVNLPWNTLLELMVDGTEEFMVDLLLNGGKGEPGWEVLCEGTLGMPSDECTGEALSNITATSPVSENLLGTFSEAFAITLAGFKFAKCTAAGGLEKGLVEGSGTIHAATGTLTASSEGLEV